MCHVTRAPPMCHSWSLAAMCHSLPRPRGALKEATTKLAKHHGALGGRAAHRVRILSGASEEVWHDLAHAAPR